MLGRSYSKSWQGRFRDFGPVASWLMGDAVKVDHQTNSRVAVLSPTFRASSAMLPDQVTFGLATTEFLFCGPPPALVWPPSKPVVVAIPEIVFLTRCSSSLQISYKFSSPYGHSTTNPDDSAQAASSNTPAAAHFHALQRVGRCWATRENV
jgi:hypothetical protein